MNSELNKPIVRFAPSPTGFLHLGSARTALLNWIYARSTGGKFLLRVEDTDQARSSKQFLEEILADIKWLGLDWDEEPIYQSRRFDVYRNTAEELLKKGLAYKEGEAFIFKVEKGRAIEIEDMIHGKIVFNTDEIKDQVMIKSDGSPAYNFCCVVDDAYLKITHIIRGDDHISNTPKQILFYEALGAALPGFAHMPLIMGPDGAKLSKRHGAVSVEEYKKQGFLPEALANYLMLLGWPQSENKEIISLSEAVKLFDIKNMSDVQARFDIQKLTWINGEYIAKKNPKELLPLIKIQLAENGIKTTGLDDERLTKIIEMYRVRIKTLAEFSELTDYFFKDNFTIDEKAARDYLSKEENKEVLKIFAEKLRDSECFKKDDIEQTCRLLAEEKNIKAAAIIHPARVAISGKMKGAGLFEIMELLGKEKTIERIKKAAEK